MAFVLNNINLFLFALSLNTTQSSSYFQGESSTSGDLDNAFSILTDQQQIGNKRPEEEENNNSSKSRYENIYAKNLYD